MTDVCHPELSKEEGAGVGDFKGEEERAESIFGKQVFAEPSRSNGTQR